MSRSALDNAAELLELVESIVPAVYDWTAELPESEEWGMLPKSKHQAMDLLETMAVACGALDPRDITWRLAQSRGSATALQSLLKVSHATSNAAINPELMVKLRRVVTLIDQEMVSLPDKTKTWMESNYPTYSGEAKS